MLNPSLQKEDDDTKFYGFYRGIVKNNNDPLLAGRCQIQVWPMFEGAEDAHLPWATYADALMGGSANIGGIFIPIIGAHVWCFFENGDWRFPVFFAGAPAMQSGTPDIPTDAQTNYPNRRVYISPGGTEILIDDTPGSQEFKASMSNGWSVVVDNDGNVAETVPGTLTANVTGAASIISQSSITLQAPAITLDGPVTATSTVYAETDVTAGPSDISLVEHVHGGVIAGGDLSAPPVP